MPRVISFIVLVAIVLLVGAVFFQVMAQFMVPLFLACVLLVIFQPWHRWVLRLLPLYPRISALITTVLILLAVLLPLVSLGWNAYVELHTIYAPERGVASEGNYTSSETAPDVAANKTEANAPEESNKEEQIAFTKKVDEIALQLRDHLKSLTGIFIPDDDVKSFVRSGQNFLASKALSGVQAAIGVLIGLAIMVIALYYFLADGPGMIETVMDLSPLDSRYEQELLERFGDVSRAVVVATLLSAVVQGALAGVGYAVALPSGSPIFLLTALTMATALVPFVGAAAVWICVCGWIYLYGDHVVNGVVAHGNPVAAIILAIYCTIVVSGIDNVIKPLILHGQSKLHPLLALLSILGGVQVLGPVGILVGPMLVSFLQALLTMLRKEIDSFGGPVGPDSKPLAESVVEAVQQVADDKGETPKHIESPAATSATVLDSSAENPRSTRKETRAGRSKRKR